VTGHCHPMLPLSARACFVILTAFLAGIAAQGRYSQQHQKRTTLRGDTFSDAAPGHECDIGHVQPCCGVADCMMPPHCCIRRCLIDLIITALSQMDLQVQT
jgi:hypothetical protein